MPSKPKDKVGKTKNLSAVTLAEKQVWEFNGAYAHIVSIGKRLVHYRMAKSLMSQAANAAPVRVGTYEAVEEYLRVNKGVLVNAPSGLINRPKADTMRKRASRERNL